ncbi:MAG TPA: amidohydrolase family protein, partial [Candidatus Hydrogenedentes bacterium]|nr:amidohydrolase family protein [Candidatus Hydrogenedentota bacterium]HOS04291.1 amidohydrolase family protein [Candidatus Hydrogenedentota bacterium]
MAVGLHHDGFRADAEWGAAPWRDVSVVDLILDPYLGGAIADAGFDPHRAARLGGHADCFAWAVADPARACEALAPALRALRLTGTAQSVQRGIEALYGVDIFTADTAAWVQLDARVRENYRQMFSWHASVMETMGLTQAIRPVWPEMYWAESRSADAVLEKGVIHTLMRVDAFMEMWREDYPRGRDLVALTGIEPVDAESWRAFLDRVFDVARRHGCLGTKQAQAYWRPLDFSETAEADVKWSGPRTQEEVRRWQDWVMHECFRRTEAWGWPHQCHVGTHNLPHSNPAPLEAVAVRYPGMKLVLLHAWPYLEQAGWLARRYANVFLDQCWQVILNPEFFRRALREWLGYVPLHKLSVGHDATSVEMAAGACCMVRRILGDVLAQEGSALGIRPSEAEVVAVDMLHHNAVRLYCPGSAGIGQSPIFLSDYR